MRSTRFLDFCLSTPWAMEPGALALHASMLARGYARREGVFADGEYGARAAPTPRARPASDRQGNIALIQVFGAMVQRASQLGPCEGGIGTEDIGSALQAALADKSVGQILMQFDSPGGSVAGTVELGSAIYAARSQKPVIGIADSMAASAAYWLLSQCTEAYCTPSGMVGSIGVITAHNDISKALEAEGVSITLITAGKFKAEGHPYAPLDPEAHGEIQSMIDGYYADFLGAVARGRGVSVATVRDGMGQGRMFRGADAVRARMIDGVATMPQVVAQMQRGGRGTRPSASASAAIERDRMEFDMLELGATLPPPRKTHPNVARAIREINLLESE